MSYVFDVMRRVYNDQIHPLMVREGKEMLSIQFEGLIEAVHSANHRCDLQGWPRSGAGDGVNKDGEASRAAKELEEEYNKVKDNKAK